LSRRRRQRRRRPAASRWRRLLVEIFEPRQLLAPLAVADSYSTPEDTLLTIAAPGILANDTSGATSAVLGSAPTRGLLTLNTNGGFTYTPSLNLFGPDSFTYRASDGTTTSDLTVVAINVTSVIDPAVAVNDSYSVVEDSELKLQYLFTNDSIDPADTGVRLVFGQQPQHGHISYTHFVLGVISYVPYLTTMVPTTAYAINSGITASFSRPFRCRDPSTIAGGGSERLQHRPTPAFHCGTGSADQRLRFGRLAGRGAPHLAPVAGAVTLNSSGGCVSPPRIQRGDEQLRQ
jgi:hypothetical protein